MGTSSHGEGDEGDEGDEGHEACEQVREGEAREARCLPWEQGGDGWRADEGQLDEEQEREDREQEGEREREEGLRPDQGLDRRRDEGAEGSRGEGIPRGEEGDASVQEGEGVLRPVSERRMSDSCNRPGQTRETAPALGSGALPLPV